MASLRMHSSDTHTATRVVVGHCPDCGRVVVVFNNLESWPLAVCSCGWHGAMTEIHNATRYEQGIVDRLAQ